MLKGTKKITYIFHFKRAIYQVALHLFTIVPYGNSD